MENIHLPLNEKYIKNKTNGWTYPVDKIMVLVFDELEIIVEESLLELGVIKHNTKHTQK